MYMGILENAHAEGFAGSKRSGPFMRFMARLEDNKIQAVKFQTHGCVPAHAAGVFLSGMALGKTAEEMEGKWNAECLVAVLGGLPAERSYIPKLAIEAFENLIANIKNYRSGSCPS